MGVWHAKYPVPPFQAQWMENKGYAKIQHFLWNEPFCEIFLQAGKIGEIVQTIFKIQNCQNTFKAELFKIAMLSKLSKLPKI